MNIAIVTGASSGMGKDFVRELDAYGFDEIWAIARREGALCELAREVKTPVRVLALDLTERESLGKIEELLEAEKPRVGYLVCAAGYGRFGSFAEVDDDESERMISLNCTSLVRLTYACIGYMDRGSKIIEIASVAAFQPLPYLNIYAATKAFVLSFSEALSFELADRGHYRDCALPRMGEDRIHRKCGEDRRLEREFLSRNVGEPICRQKSAPLLRPR